MSIIFEDHVSGSEVAIDITAGKNGPAFLSILGRLKDDVWIDLSTENMFEVAAFFKMVEKAKADYEELTGHRLDG